MGVESCGTSTGREVSCLQTSKCNTERKVADSYMFLSKLSSVFQGMVGTLSPVVLNTAGRERVNQVLPR